MSVRLIPRLDIKGPNLVKGIQFEGLRVLGQPWAFARAYYQQGADELLYVDVVASLYGRNSLDEIIARTAREIFIPLTVGGGLRTLEDVRRVLEAGADKVAINTAALRRPQLIADVARVFGSSTLVASIEAIRSGDGYQAYADYGREATGVDAIEWARRAEDLGAGELLISSIDRDGTGRGFDLELIAPIARAAGIPVIASGGAGSAADVRRAIDAGADAVALASMLHYPALDRGLVEPRGDEGEGNVEFLSGRRQGGSSRFGGLSLSELRADLRAAGLDLRPL
ncbi:MAG: imidazole glycerol phosphate synthase subunit HisF [Acidobacteria bacterium]|nr:MAG: imidazole glycerol phosphate synthase subunit HisF [Acidobacteriota bacterium]